MPSRGPPVDGVWMGPPANITLLYSTLKFLNWIPAFCCDQGALISVCENDQIHLWTLRQKKPKIVHSLKFQREKITTCHLPLTSRWLYIGTERGNVHIANIESFVLSGYIINWNKAIELTRKTHPGAVVHLSDNPIDNNKLLIGFESGAIAMWDLKSKVAEFRVNCTETLHSVWWHHEGKQFMCSHADGSLTIWNTRIPQKAQSVLMPHAQLNKDGKPETCRGIQKINWMSVRNGEPYIIFSGGMPYEKGVRTPSLTVMHAKNTTVLEMEHNVVDFITLCSSPWNNDFQDPYGIIVLLQNDLVVVDLTSPGYPCFENPYPMDIHESPVTACLYIADCPPDLTPAFYSVGSKQKKTGFSEKDWPVKGGEWGTTTCSYPEIIITGHADGSLKFWDISAMSLQVLYKLKTAKVFDKSKCKCPDADDDPFAIQMIHLCTESRLLSVSGLTHVVLFRFSKQEASFDIHSLEISIHYEIYDDLDPAETCEYPPIPPPKPNMPSHGGSINAGSESKVSRLLGWSTSPAPKEEEIVTSVKVKQGSRKWAMGFQPDLSCVLTWIDGEPPPPITSISTNSSYGLMAFGNECGIAIVDIVQKTCLLNMGTPDLYGSMDPYSRAPRSPKSRQLEGLSQAYTEECKSPTTDQPDSNTEFEFPADESEHHKPHLSHSKSSPASTPTTPKPSMSTLASIEEVSGPILSQSVPGSLLVSDSFAIAPENTSSPDEDPSITTDTDTERGYCLINNPLSRKSRMRSASGGDAVKVGSAPIVVSGRSAGDPLLDKDMPPAETVASDSQLDHGVPAQELDYCPMPKERKKRKGSLFAKLSKAKEKDEKVNTVNDEKETEKEDQEMDGGNMDETHECRTDDKDLIMDGNANSMGSFEESEEAEVLHQKLCRTQSDVLPRTHHEQHSIMLPRKLSSQEIRTSENDDTNSKVDKSMGAGGTGFFRKMSRKIKGSFHAPSKKDPLAPVDDSTDGKRVKAKKHKIMFLNLMSEEQTSCGKMTYKDYVLLDKADGSFSRSRSSSMSSLENINKEAIQCLTFADAYSRKSDMAPCPCLWVGTSLGSVLVISVSLPEEGDRKSRPVMVSPSGTIFRLKGSILAMSFLDCNGILIPSVAEQWRDNTREELRDANRRAPYNRQQSMSSMKARMSPTSSTEVSSDQQFAIMCSEKQARVVSLPSQTCAYKQKITETSVVARAEVVCIKESVSMACYLANGHIMAFSLPSLKPLIDVDFLPLNDVRIAKTFSFSNYGHALFFVTPTEVQKITISAEVSESLTEMLGELFLPCDTPEAPKQSFFKNLFTGGPSLLDRAELFGEGSGKASKGTARYSPGAAGTAQVQERSAHANSEIGRAKQAAIERGERLGDLEDRTAAMRLEAEAYGGNAHAIMAKYRDKKWYQF